MRAASNGVSGFCFTRTRLPLTKLVQIVQSDVFVLLTLLTLLITNMAVISDFILLCNRSGCSIVKKQRFSVTEKDSTAGHTHIHLCVYIK